jgi:hypothetical protein
MALTDFFRINLPYGMKRNSNNEWFFFNREYVPLGWNTTNRKSLHSDAAYSELPVYTKYNHLSEKILLKLAWDSINGIQRNDNSEIEKVFFYNDKTNPQTTPKYWPDYLGKIQLLSKCEVKR